MFLSDYTTPNFDTKGAYQFYWRLYLKRLPLKLCSFAVGRYSERLYTHNHNFVKAINTVQKSWTATAYKEYEKMSLRDLIRRSGHSQRIPRPKPAPMTDEIQQQILNLPESWDWRNVQGVNYVSPVRNQESCGSCYSFASMGMLEARIRILTNNSQTPILSPQEVVSCSPYAQGKYFISELYYELFIWLYISKYH